MTLKPEEFETAISFPVADIHAQTDGVDMRVNHSYPVVTPDEDKKEFIVAIRASSLRSWRLRLSTLNGKKIPWPEFFLAVSSLGIGSILSAIASDVKLATFKGTFFYLILPPITVGVIVSYIFVRRIENVSVSSVVNALLSDIPNMDNSEREN